MSGQGRYPLPSQPVSSCGHHTQVISSQSLPLGRSYREDSPETPPRILLFSLSCQVGTGEFTVPLRPQCTLQEGREHWYGIPSSRAVHWPQQGGIARQTGVGMRSKGASVKQRSSGGCSTLVTAASPANHACPMVPFRPCPQGSSHRRRQWGGRAGRVLPGRRRVVRGWPRPARCASGRSGSRERSCLGPAVGRRRRRRS